jgi:hypothetical protein
VKHLAKIFAVLALTWAVAAPAFVFLREVRVEQDRRLTALAAARLGAAAEDMTNDVVRIPRASVELVRELADQERVRGGIFTTVILASSAVTAGLALLVLSQKHDPTA